MPEQKCSLRKKLKHEHELEECKQELYQYMGWWLCPDHGYIKPVKEA